MHRYVRKQFALLGALGTTLLAACSGGQAVIPVTHSVIAADTTASSATRETMAVAPSLAVTIGGLPAGAAGNVSIYGPYGWSTNLKTSSTITNRTPGTYNVVAANVQYAGKSYAPSPSAQTKTLNASGTTSVSVTYAAVPQYGTLYVGINGLPYGAQGNVAVAGPNGWGMNLASSTTLTNRAPGTYTFTPANVSYGGRAYAATPASQTATVNANGTTTVTVTYAAYNPYGILAVTIGGLPLGAMGNVAISGPNGWGMNLATSTTLTNRPPGNYTLVPVNVSYAGKTYAAAPATQTKSVSADMTTAATVSYSPVVQPPPPPAADQYLYRDGPVDSNDKWGFFTRECVSYVAWRLNQDGIPFKNDYKMGPNQHWSNASNWLNAAAIAGVRVDHNPSIGAVAWIHYTKVDHVAYVSAVTAGGQVLLEEYNYPNLFHYNTRTIPASSVNWFIHFR